MSKLEKAAFAAGIILVVLSMSMVWQLNYYKAETERLTRECNLETRR